MVACESLCIPFDGNEIVDVGEPFFLGGGGGGGGGRGEGGLLLVATLEQDIAEVTFSLPEYHICQFSTKSLQLFCRLSYTHKYISTTSSISVRFQHFIIKFISFLLC